VNDWRDLLAEASRLRKAGRIDEAIDAYKRLLALKSDLPDSWYNLGWLQRRARAFEDAIASYSQALALGIRDPEEVHLNRAVIYSDHLHRPEEAERELRAALDKNPRYLPALLNLGNLFEDLGDRDAATKAYQQALAIDRDNSSALARLAGVSRDGAVDDELAGRLISAIARPDRPAAEKADLGFALAGLLDAAGHYGEAFAAAADANAASRAAAGVRYDRAAHERFVDAVIATFDRPVTRDDSPAPLFICGMFRSGSTLVEQILAAHSRVRAGGELDLIPALVERIAGYPAAAGNADDRTIGDWRADYLGGLPEQPAPDRLLTDKRPDNFLHIGLIKTLFPSAKIVHTRRNPLDNLLSLYFLHLDPGMAYALDLEDAAHWYGQYLRLMEHWKSLYPADIFDVDYDRLVQEPQPMLEQLLGFLGLSWEDGLLDFHMRGAPVKTASVWQVREPLHARSSGRWRNYRAELEPLARLLDGGD
jgi:tetratricopeptide (TPR) repeat protein